MEPLTYSQVKLKAISYIAQKFGVSQVEIKLMYDTNEHQTVRLVETYIDAYNQGVQNQIDTQMEPESIPEPKIKIPDYQHKHKQKPEWNN